MPIHFRCNLTIIIEGDLCYIKVLHTQTTPPYLTLRMAINYSIKVDIATLSVYPRVLFEHIFVLVVGITEVVFPITCRPKAVITRFFCS